MNFMRKTQVSTAEWLRRLCRRSGWGPPRCRGRGPRPAGAAGSRWRPPAPATPGPGRTAPVYIIRRTYLLQAKKRQKECGMAAHFRAVGRNSVTRFCIPIFFMILTNLIHMLKYFPIWSRYCPVSKTLTPTPASWDTGTGNGSSYSSSSVSYHLMRRKIRRKNICKISF